MSNRDTAELHREIAQLRAELNHVATCSQNRDEENAQLRSELDAARKWIEADSVRIGQLRTDLARVTAERENWKRASEFHDQAWHEESAESDALRARVAELEQIVAASLKAAPVGHIPTHTAERLPEIIADIATACSEQSEEREQAEARVAEVEERAERYRLTTLRQDATIAELTTDGNAVTLAANLARVSQRVAELEAENGQLKADRKWTSETVVRNLIGRNGELVAALEKIAKADPLENGRYAAFRASAALARAESAVPKSGPNSSEIRTSAESATLDHLRGAAEMARPRKQGGVS